MQRQCVTSLIKAVCDARSQVSNTRAVVCLEVNRNSLDRHESDGHVELLEHDLRHAFRDRSRV